MAKIDDIKNILDEGNGPADPSRYFVQIVPPITIGTIGAEVLSQIVSNVGGAQVESVGGTLAKFSFTSKIESINLPGKTLLTFDYTMYGTQIKHPYGVLFAPVTMTFICTESMVEKKVFEGWHRLITDPHSNHFSYWDEYVSPRIAIIKMPPEATSIGDALEAALTAAGASAIGSVSTHPYHAVVLEEAYPINISSQELGYGNNTYLTLQVEFAYRKYLTDGDAINTFSLF